MHLAELDDILYDIIFSHLRYIDLVRLSLTCRTLRKIVKNASLQRLNCTRSWSWPILRLPYANNHHMVDPDLWRDLKASSGTKKESIYIPKLYFNARHRDQLNLASLRAVILDGTFINVLDIISFISSSPHLQYLSTRFCKQVQRLLLQNYLDSLREHRHQIGLERLDVLGIQGLPFFEPKYNGMRVFDEREIELIGTGPEYDYTDRWREEMYDFRMSLERVPTTHGRVIATDIDRCSQAYCRNFDLGRRELADPTAPWLLPPCLICQTLYKQPICRGCVAARSCKLCSTFICPTCYNIDTYFELADLTGPQPWLDILTSESDTHTRNCADPDNLRLGSKAILMSQQVHRHLTARETAEMTLSEGYVNS